MNKPFNLSEWLVAGIIDGYKTNAIPFCETTNRVAMYLSKNLISSEQAEVIALACSEPNKEPVIKVEDETEIEVTETEQSESVVNTEQTDSQGEIEAE